MREQGQRLFDVAPVIGIELLLLGKDARVLEVRDADVECGEREPRPIGLGDPLGQFRLQ